MLSLLLFIAMADKPISTPPIKIQSAQGEMPTYGCAGDAKLWILVHILDPDDPRNNSKVWKPTVKDTIPTLDPRGGQPACWPHGVDPNTLLPPPGTLNGTAK